MLRVYGYKENGRSKFNPKLVRNDRLITDQQLRQLLSGLIKSSDNFISPLIFAFVGNDLDTRQ